LAIFREVKLPEDGQAVKVETYRSIKQQVKLLCDNVVLNCKGKGKGKAILDRP
jgi:hypothetical protein